MEWAQLYTDLTAQLVSGTDLPWWQDFFVNFTGPLWTAGAGPCISRGVLTTVRVTALALVMGIVLGVLVAVIRSAHDQQRPGRHNPFLGILNLICKILPPSSGAPL